MLSVTLRQLRYVVAVARFEGISSAAAVLHVSQPAISVAISHLESEVGRPLFIRKKGNSVVPTSFGKAFIQDAQAILVNLEQLIDPAAKANSERFSPVVIGCFKDLAPILLAPALKVFQNEYPEIPVSMREGDFDLLAEEMRTGRIDFAITYELGLDESFKHDEIASLFPHVIVGENHPLAAKNSISLVELAKEPLVLSERELSVQHMVGLFHKFDLSPRLVHRVASLETMRSLAANGLGVGLSYTNPKPRQSYDGKPLVILEISDDVPAESIIIATHTANPPTKSTQMLIDVVASMVNL